MSTKSTDPARTEFAETLGDLRATWRRRESLTSAVNVLPPGVIPDG